MSIHRYHIKTAGQLPQTGMPEQIISGTPGDPFLLLFVYCLRSGSSPAAAAVFYFHKYQRAAVQRDQVDLRLPAAKIFFKNPIGFFLQIIRCSLFIGCTCFSFIQAFIPALSPEGSVNTAAKCQTDGPVPIIHRQKNQGSTFCFNGQSPYSAGMSSCGSDRVRIPGWLCDALRFHTPYAAQTHTQAIASHIPS